MIWNALHLHVDGLGHTALHCMLQYKWEARKASKATFGSITTGTLNSSLPSPTISVETHLSLICSSKGAIVDTNLPSFHHPSIPPAFLSLLLPFASPPAPASDASDVASWFGCAKSANTPDITASQMNDYCHVFGHNAFEGEKLFRVS